MFRVSVQAELEKSNSKASNFVTASNFTFTPPRKTESISNSPTPAFGSPGFSFGSQNTQTATYAEPSSLFTFNAPTEPTSHIFKTSHAHDSMILQNNPQEPKLRPAGEVFGTPQPRGIARASNIDGTPDDTTADFSRGPASAEKISDGNREQYWLRFDNNTPTSSSTSPNKPNGTPYLVANLTLFQSLALNRIFVNPLNNQKSPWQRKHPKCLFFRA